MLLIFSANLVKFKKKKMTGTNSIVTLVLGQKGYIITLMHGEKFWTSISELIFAFQ
jgi:hypothetical protein